MNTVRIGGSVLARAAAKLGGVESLAERLKISQRLLRYYITGAEPVPDVLFMGAVDVILEEAPTTLRELSGEHERLAK